jgi:hypothetical protein
MFRADLLIPEYKNLIGWREHHDTSEIDIATPLTVTETGEYYQQKHPALRLDIIKATLPDNMDLDKYLEQKVRDGSVEIFNDILQYRQVNDYGKTLLKQSQLLNRYGFMNDKIVNENRFVGFQIRLHTASGIQAVINQIGFQFSDVESFKLYLFHTSKSDPIKEIDVTTTGTAQWDWKATEILLTAFETEEYNGGAFVLGYYQEDLTGNAINNTDFNWDRGACAGCSGSNHTSWKNIAEYFTVYPIYVPNGNFTKGKMFDLNDAFYINNESYGLNLRLTSRCDLTNFFIENKFVFKNLLALKVTLLILNDMKFSQEINFIEENIKMMIIRDLEGDKETNALNTTRQYRNELKSVTFNISGINEKCLPCEGSAYEPDYGVV